MHQTVAVAVNEKHDMGDLLIDSKKSPKAAPQNIVSLEMSQAFKDSVFDLHGHFFSDTSHFFVEGVIE